jgi:hypothetical protein
MATLKNVKSQVIRLRKPDGSEDRVHLFLDEEGFLTGANNLELLQGWSAHQSQETKIPGLRKLIDGQGNTQLKPDASLQRDLHFFSEHSPCWFPECEQLRENYAAELGRLKEDPNCPQKTCYKAPLIQKYLKLVREAQNGK